MVKYEVLGVNVTPKHKGIVFSVNGKNYITYNGELHRIETKPRNRRDRFNLNLSNGLLVTQIIGRDQAVSVVDTVLTTLFERNSQYVHFRVPDALIDAIRVYRDKVRLANMIVI